MAAQIKEFYRNKNILLTGGTGFLGLGLVEKMLRAFPDVGDIFMIVRQGRQGQSVRQRREVYIENPVFDGLRAQQNADFSKLKWIAGDLRQADLGLSRRTIAELQGRLNVIIHGAATVKFLETLKTAIDVNVRATNDLLNIASGCKKLDCFVHISTAYCQTRRSVQHVEETIMKHPITAPELMQIANSYTLQELHTKTEDFLQDWPNTYTYTKNAAENACAERRDQFPLVIYRPAIVVPSYAEPVPYWIGNNMAFARILMESHRGLVLDEALPHVNGNCVPVDFVINAMLMAAYRTSIDRAFNIYNYTTDHHPFSFVECFECYVRNFKGYENLVKRRKQLLSMQPPVPGSKEHQMLTYLRQYQDFHRTALYFLQNHFTFSNDNIVRMWTQMADDERQLLPFDLSCIDWQMFYEKMRVNMYGTKPINAFDAII